LKSKANSGNNGAIEAVEADHAGKHNRDPATENLIRAAQQLRKAVSRLNFAPPVACVYNPLDYAWVAHEDYLRTFGGAPKRVVFLGMNPGPFGMVQTGVPFGEIGAVRDWLGIHRVIRAPGQEHPRRPVLGFECTRSEVSGQRLWGLFASEFGTAVRFFRDHFVLNYCPLAFVEESGRNRTPDHLAPGERDQLFGVCDEHLRVSVKALEPKWVIAVGDFAFRRAQAVFAEGKPKLGRILHPCLASPAANRDWAGTAKKQLQQLGAWP